MTAGGSTELVDTSAAEKFLRNHLGAVADVAPLANGEWARAFSFTIAGGEYVVRFAAQDEDFIKDRLTQQFAGPDLPIPRIVEIGAAYGGFYAISERAYGVYLEELDGPQASRVLPAVFRTLDALRLADVSATTGYGPCQLDGNGSHTSWSSYLLEVATDDPSRRIAGWRVQLEQHQEAARQFDDASAWLTAHVDACPDVRHLVHNDMLHGNVLVENDAITAVIDWGCVMYGDFVYDLALAVFWSAWFPALDQLRLVEAATAHYASIGLVVENFDLRLAVYAVHLGLGSLAYQAFRGRWDDLAWSARRIDQLLTGARE